MTYEAWIAKNGGERKALLGARAYFKPSAKVSQAQAAYEALRQAGYVAMPWQEVQRRGGFNALPQRVVTAMQAVASGDVEKFKPSAIEKIAGTAAQKAIAPIAGAVSAIASTPINKAALESGPVQAIGQFIKQAIETIPRAVVTNQVTNRQTGNTRGEIANELQILKNMIPGLSENPKLDQILREKGVGYKDVLLQQGTNPRLAAYGGFLADTLVPDPLTSAVGLAAHGLGALKGAVKQGRAVKAIEAGKAAEEAALTAARERDLAKDGDKLALPEKTPATGIFKEGTMPAMTEADRLMKLQRDVKTLKTWGKNVRASRAEALAREQAWIAEQEAKAHTQAVGELAGTLEKIQKQKFASQVARHAEETIAFQKKALAEGKTGGAFLSKAQLLREEAAAGGPRVYTRMTPAPVAAQETPASQLEAMRSYVGAPKTQADLEAAAKAAEAQPPLLPPPPTVQTVSEQIAKKAPQVKAAKAVKLTYAQKDIDSTVKWFSEVGVPPKAMEEMQAELAAGKGQHWIDLGKQQRQAQYKELSRAGKITEGQQRLHSLAQQEGAFAPKGEGLPATAPPEATGAPFDVPDYQTPEHWQALIGEAESKAGMKAASPEVLTLQKKIADVDKKLSLTKTYSDKEMEWFQLQRADWQTQLDKRLAKEAPPVAPAPVPEVAPPATLPENGPTMAQKAGETITSIGRASSQVLGKEDAVVTPVSGETVPVRWGVVSLDDLAPSHTDTFQSNPAYSLPEMQPRDLSTAANQVKIKKIGQQLDPRLTGLSASTAEGAPVVGLDNLVESGNGRVLGYRQARAANPKGWQAYSAWLSQNAPTFGIDPEALKGIKDPVLVRVRTSNLSDAERVRLAQAMGASPTAGRSAVEIAQGDAKAVMQGGLLNLFDSTADIRGRANAEFRKRFMAQIPATEHQGLTVKGGDLSLAGEKRMLNALFASAFEDRTLLTNLLDSPDVTIRNLAKAMAESAPQFARLKAKIASGALQDVDVTGQISEAAKMLQSLRESGKPLSVLATDIFETPESAFIKKMVGDFAGKGMSAKKIKDTFTRYVDTAERSGATQGGLDLGIAPRQVSKEALWNQAVESGGRLFDESGKVLVPKIPSQADMHTLLEKYINRDTLPKITRFQRQLKMYGGVEGTWRDMVGSTIIHAQAFGLDPMKLLNDVIDLKLAEFANSPKNQALEHLLTTSAKDVPVAAPGGFIAGMESAGQAADLTPKLPFVSQKVSDTLRNWRQGNNRFWEKLGAQEQLKRMAMSGNPQDVALAQKILKGEGKSAGVGALPTSSYPVTWNDFSPVAKDNLKFGITAVSGDPYALPDQIRFLSRQGVLSLFPSWALQVPYNRLKAIPRGLAQGNLLPLTNAYKEGKAMLRFTQPPSVDEQGKPITPKLLPPPAGNTQYETGGYQFGSFDPYRHGVAYDTKGNVTGRVNVSGITSEGPQTALGNLPSNPLQALIAVLGSGAAGITAPFTAGILPRTAWDTIQKAYWQPENPYQPLVNVGGLSQEEADKQLKAAMQPGMVNPGAPANKWGKAAVTAARSFIPPEWNMLLGLPGLSPALGLGRPSSTGKPSMEPIDLLIQLLGGQSRPASLEDLLKGPYYQSKDYLQQLKAANRKETP